jgi:hypothetical protein
MIPSSQQIPPRRSPPILETWQQRRADPRPDGQLESRALARLAEPRELDALREAA